MFDYLKNKSVFITGATGLIGSTLVKALLKENQKNNLNLTVIALIRNQEKADLIFRNHLGADEICSLRYVMGTVESLPQIDLPIDYIVHAASNTSSRAFVDNPVEVVNTAVEGTCNVLNLAKKKNIKKMVYLSTMEVYGYPKRGHKVTEKEIGALSPLSVRNSYPLSKILCENLCVDYANEYNLPVVIARLTQTFGPGVDIEHDQRIFAYFARCIINKEDIILKTKGETERCYLYTEDAVSAILKLLEKGKIGEAYTVADPNTYCSIADMAEVIAKYAGVKVGYELQDSNSSGFANTLYMNLDTSKMELLGWKPKGLSLLEIYKKMICTTGD